MSFSRASNKVRLLCQKIDVSFHELHQIPRFLRFYAINKKNFDGSDIQLATKLTVGGGTALGKIKSGRGFSISQQNHHHRHHCRRLRVHSQMPNPDRCLRHHLILPWRQFIRWFFISFLLNFRKTRAITIKWYLPPQSFGFTDYVRIVWAYWNGTILPTNVPKNMLFVLLCSTTRTTPIEKKNSSTRKVICRLPDDTNTWGPVSKLLLSPFLAHPSQQ